MSRFRGKRAERWHGKWDGLGPAHGGRESCDARDCVSSVLDGQRPRGEHSHECLLSSVAHRETCSTLHKDTDPKISDQTKPPGWLYFWASAAGNCLGDAMGMAQQAQGWQFPVSHRHW